MSEKAEELEESDVKSEVRRESKRVKKVEEYFQWETLKDWEKEMYFDFVKTAKKTWTNNGYDDEEVEKTVLNKISLLRFCIARDFHPEKAFKMWISWVEWRLEYQPHKIKWREVKNSSLNKCFYLCGQNKKGCPLIVICPGATSEVYDIDLMWKLAAYVMEKACRRADRNGTTQMCVIFDRTNMNNGVEKKWLPLYKQLSTLIQDYYPERLHQAYVLHMNWFARVIFQLCKPFIAKKTRNKLIILANQDHLEDHVDTEVYDPRNPHSFKE
uniref:CRAL-TRIO domain-containing protein n=1 Tax=Euplotes harpa TaxID=151035 RepID=A0A7S3JLZ9_9SPIT|mmetsp:Transcript_5049/g.5950  ORF Transcript_5049/g.5950 Transcript_5049/m.5950 type:complete len:270 (+) Transcript_5049:284-1093(+)